MNPNEKYTENNLLDFLSNMNVIRNNSTHVDVNLFDEALILWKKNISLKRESYSNGLDS
jgi:hypothetical protein